MKDLKNARAVLTGASRGIGVYIARALAREGVNLVLAARSAAPLAELAQELARQGVQALAMPLDLGDTNALDGFASRCEAELGPIDILINNAGVEQNGAFVDFSPADIESMLHIDLAAPLLLTQKFLARMIERGRGHIVNIASLAGKSATPYNVPYSAAKGGLIAFTHSLRAELRDTGVSASVVCPGFVSEVGMYASKKRNHGLQEPAMLGTSSPEQVASAVVRALREDVLEILVNPGPMRLMQAVNQLFPEVGGWVVNRMGVGEMFRKVAEGERRGGGESTNGS
ncbi:MAG TPA: SDR family NAD(P)-dependent oxidoreductase [Polyangiaceae bacterium]